MSSSIALRCISQDRPPCSPVLGPETLGWVYPLPALRRDFARGTPDHHNGPQQSICQPAVLQGLTRSLSWGLSATRTLISTIPSWGVEHILTCCLCPSCQASRSSNLPQDQTLHFLKCKVYSWEEFGEGDVSLQPTSRCVLSHSLECPWRNDQVEQQGAPRSSSLSCLLVGRLEWAPLRFLLRKIGLESITA